MDACGSGICLSMLKDVHLEVCELFVVKCMAYMGLKWKWLRVGGVDGRVDDGVCM